MQIAKNKPMKESQYREIRDRISYSSLKLFYLDRQTFYKNIIVGERNVVRKNDDMILGDLVDCLFFTPEEFDSKFSIASCNKPTGQLGELCDEIYQCTLKFVDEENNVTESFSSIFDEAVNNLKRAGKFKGKESSSILKLFTSPDKDGVIAKDYYDECRRSFKKTPVDHKIVGYAQKVIDTIKESQNLASKILFDETDEDHEVINQLAVLFQVKGLDFKCMMDKVIIDHKTKTIRMYDLKVTWQNEDFMANFLKMYYYLQLGVYTLGIWEWMKNDRPDLKDYEIEPFSFITADSSSRTYPIVYKSNEEWLQKSLYGFTLPTGKRFKGVFELVDEINFHLKEGNWKSSKEVLENNGLLELINI